jgi:hypothetical protein
MANKVVTDIDWYEWTNSTYNTQTGRKFIQQLFRICRFWSSPKTLIAGGFSPQEIMAYENICKQILNGLSKENIADLFLNTRKIGEN